MVSHFPIEPMHAVYLGAVNRMLTALFSNKVAGVFLSPAAKNSLEETFLNFIPYVPMEFERKPRTFKV